MLPQGKGKRWNHDIENPNRINWREAVLHSSIKILTVVKEAATYAPTGELRRAASLALIILETVQRVKENKEAYERLGEDSGGLVAAIWRSYKKAETPDRWLSAEMREILEELTGTLQNICSFIKDQLSRNRAIRVIFSKVDVVKIGEYREHLNYAMQKFELQSHMNINDILLQIVRKNDELSEQITHRNEEDAKHILEITAREARDQEELEDIHKEEMKKVTQISVLESLKQVEISRLTEDERRQSDELKKIEKETKERESELQRLRSAASTVELANRLKKAQEEEIAELKRRIGAEEDSRRNATIQTQSMGSKRREWVEEEEEWEGRVMVEEATSDEEEEEEELVQPVSRSPKAGRNSSKSPNRRPVVLEHSADDEEAFESMRRRSKRTVRRPKPSRASLRVIDPEDSTEEDSTSEEEDYARRPQRRGSKAKRRPQSAPRSLPLNVDDFMPQIQGLGFGVRHGSESNLQLVGSMYTPNIHSASHHNQYFPTYGPPMGAYGYGIGGKGTIVNSGIGNITNNTISNVGNNNSVKTVYGAPRTRGRRRSP